MYYKIVKNELMSFIKKFQLNPFDFLTEYDLQSYLYVKLFDNFERNNITVNIETTDDDKSVKIFNPSRKIKINPTRREYPADEGFDIAIIDKNKLSKKLSAYWHQQLKVAIELKYHRSSMGNSINPRIKGFIQDIGKLETYSEKIKNDNFYGIAMLYIQNISEDKELKLERQLEEKDCTKLSNFENNLFQNRVDGFIVTSKYIYQYKGKQQNVV